MNKRWTANHAVNLRDFLNTETGRSLMEELTEQLPKIEGRTMEQVALEGSAIKGYLDCLKNIESHRMANAVHAPSSTNVDVT